MSIKVIIPKKWIEDALVAIKVDNYEKLEEFFQIMTGLVAEQKGKHASINVQYNGLSVKNGAYIYSLNIEGTYDKLLEILSHRFLINMLECISPYSAHHSIVVESTSNKKKRNVYYINIGHSNGFSYNLPSVIPIESTPAELPNAPKKQKLEENTIDIGVNNCLIDYYDSYITLKFIVPQAQQGNALEHVGFSSLTNFFDALEKSIKVENKTVQVNEVSRKNGAYVFIMEVAMDYDNMAYIFNDKVIEYMRRISPYTVDTIMRVFTPRLNGSMIITYEENPLYHIVIGQRSHFQWYFGEIHDSESSLNDVRRFGEILDESSLNDVRRFGEIDSCQSGSDTDRYLGEIHDSESSPDTDMYRSQAEEGEIAPDDEDDSWLGQSEEQDRIVPINELDVSAIIFEDSQENIIDESVDTLTYEDTDESAESLEDMTEITEITNEEATDLPDESSAYHQLFQELNELMIERNKINNKIIHNKMQLFNKLKSFTEQRNQINNKIQEVEQFIKNKEFSLV